RMEEEETKITTITGSSDCRAFTSGYRFTLSDYYREDMDKKDYVLTHIEHEVREVSDYYGASIENMGSESPYINRFKCIPFDVPYRPSRDTVKPVVRGTQTAIVVGPAGEEIYTDEHGRIKVQFHWDREGENNENSSCWIRVSQVSAGAGWGAIDVPRIGHEVIVDFLEGYPDRPIITGRVYHGINRPPFDLPAGGMVSGSKSNSTPGGGGYNEMSMNDTKGEEGMTVHAQKDMNTTVKNDQSVSVVSGNRTVTVKAGTLTETSKGVASLTVQAGARTVKVTGGDYSATASDAIVLHGKGKGVEITGDAEGVGITGNGKGVGITGNGKGVGITGNGEGVGITGNGKGVGITGNGEGVGIKGSPDFFAEGTSEATLKGPVVNIGNAEVNISGTKITISAGSNSIVIDAAGITIQGALVKIN
ncbi:MAG: type VI secretion system tip protein VgrG, partial [Deltaproteobacteria bacterium]|nr:type VI secretion system tip protein VgrG [Deltaproteobacteria bacterium]